MTNDELRALADALEPMARAPRFEDFDVPAFCAWVRACADAKPVGYVTANGLRSLRQDDATVLLYAHDYLIRPDHVALYTYPAPAVPQAEPKRDWSAIDAAIREYLDGYELIGENDAGADACYTPTERELYLIYDAINGLLADESFVAAISTRQAEPKREPLSEESPHGSVERLVWRLRVAATKLGRSDEWEDLRDDLHHAAAEIEQLKGAAVVALDALETHAKQYPHMQKGYTIDAIGSLRAVLTNGGSDER